ncbi:hypothetical protein B484DRAFT_451367 [Ochromonadaceae sp. CCMP2298]|nr:hypothetical protein B484DRAFT_451367 [Ochromonadaceae sp. CCMP2298]
MLLQVAALLLAYHACAYTPVNRLGGLSQCGGSIGRRVISGRRWRRELLLPAGDITDIGKMLFGDGDDDEDGIEYEDDFKGVYINFDEEDRGTAQDLDKSPAVSLFSRLYEAVFFYGLETPDIKKRLLTERGLEQFRKRKRQRTPTNPFFTPSEQLGLYLLEKGSFEKGDKGDRRDRGDRGDRRDRGDRGAMGKGSRKEPKEAYDPNDAQSLQRYAAGVKKYVDRVERELRVVKVALVSAEAASEEGEEGEEGKTGRAGTVGTVGMEGLEEGIEAGMEEDSVGFGDSERVADLKLRLEELLFKLKNAKVELVTVQTLLDDL